MKVDGSSNEYIFLRVHPLFIPSILYFIILNYNFYNFLLRKIDIIIIIIIISIVELRP